MNTHRISARRRTLVHIVPSLKVGGLEMLLHRLVQTQAQNWSVHVICLDEIGQVADGLRQSGAVVHDLRGLTVRPWRKLLRLVALLRRLRPDVIHTHNPSPQMYAVLAYPFARPGSLVHTRHGQQRMFRKLAPFVNRLSARWTARTIAVSDDVAAMVREKEGFPASKVSVLKNGIDTSIYRRSCGPIHEAITVGRLHALKDHATAIRAAALVVKRYPLFRLRIVGEGGERHRLAALRSELGLEQHVELLGTRHDIPALLEQSGLFVISSVSEGLPLALLEAMAARLPIVSTGVGGIPEVIDDGASGILVPASDPGDLADAICRIIAEPARARHLGEAGWRTVTSSFALNHLAECYDTIYENALRAA